ncbi:ThiF family adenylyltransferase [Tsukamurella tyrosinosolvens]|uniref:ThiF family adenylyltransferase n=1 Tax=Tsukamurella tyrosinosolvens TaxID=57704 RepID=UPI001CE0F8CB|nr:ThiF family adenylyltransferase [Tsukamurella tyrosinosolvens]MCA4997290.1 ThiF family adenylyltransferase [Tsukamurella tyrosinosolvens]
MTEDPADVPERLRLTCLESTERLIDVLAARDFECQDEGLRIWRGMVRMPSGAGTAVDINIPAGYPYLPPVVTPLDRTDAAVWRGVEIADYHEVPRVTWHRERGGHLCLFEHEDHTRLPWASPEALLNQIGAWLTQQAAGWPGDPPSLDVNRYLEQTGQIVLYDDLEKVVGSVVGITHERGSLWAVGRPLRVPRVRNGQQGRWRTNAAMVLDIGELRGPVADWTSLLAATGNDAKRVAREVTDFGLCGLILVYRRGSERGVLALRIGRRDGQDWTLQAHQTAPLSVEALVRRSHPDHVDLAQQRVAVVGVGAIGSVVAELLQRSGVGMLHLVDADRVFPGNVVRHIATAADVGSLKVDAVAARLRGAVPTPTVTSETNLLSTIEEACAILGDHDLVIDASADSTASSLLAAASRVGAGRALSVAILADGYAIRVDHLPESVEDALPTLHLPPSAHRAYEVGCSSPVSTTPPTAVWEAAAIAARHAIEALLRADEACAGEQRVIATRHDTK